VEETKTRADEGVLHCRLHLLAFFEPQHHDDSVYYYYLENTPGVELEAFINSSISQSFPVLSFYFIPIDSMPKAP
jgi:hypothetical protein